MRFWFRRSDVTSAPSRQSAAQVDTWIAEGNVLEDRGEIEKAIALYQLSVETAPDAWRAWINLGNALRGLGRYADAAERYRRAITIEPGFAGAHQNLGSALLDMGSAEEAAHAFRESVRLEPGGIEAWIGLGAALETTWPEQAIEAYESALALDASHPAAASMFARLELKLGDAHGALRTLDLILQKDPSSAAALCARAMIQKELGYGAAAARTYRDAVAADPTDLAAWDDYLFALNLDETAEAATITAEHRRFGEMLAARVPAMRSRVPRDREKVLRIGYVSPDFRRHSVACFVEPLLRHHDRSIVEVHCYYNHATSDEITRRFISLTDHWHAIASLDDATVAQQIADDGIDVLVDLAGHTPGNRLGVFARKPAPLQFTWLGYLCTTGLGAIDYRLCDMHTDPPGTAENWQIETPARLPDAQWCYQPQAQLPAPTSLPFLEHGHWTFGSFNQVSKLNPSLLARWSALLATIPQSRLRIVGVTCSDFEINARTIFEANEIDPARIDFIGRVPIERYFSGYGEVDIALDSSPYNGATTTCDALLMGVPIVAIAGERAISRSGVSLLRVMGLDDWIADSEAEFTATIHRKLRDPEALAQLRAELPQRMRASALMDGNRFARNVEALFRRTWIEQCDRSASH
jgi:protein O-GlcNAc transferase